MDLLFASDVLEPAIGGAERSMLEWAHGLRTRGHGVRTVSLRASRRPSEDGYWRWRAEQRREIGELVADAVAARRPSVVAAQLHGAPAALAVAARNGIPTVLVVPSYEALCKLAFAPGSDCPGQGDCVSCPAAARLAPGERAALAAGRAEHDAALLAARAIVVPSRAMAVVVQRWTGRDATVVWPVGPELPAPATASPDGSVVCAAASWSAHKGAALLPALIATIRGADERGRRRERPVRVTAPGLDQDQCAGIRAAGGALIAAAPVAELLTGASLVLIPSQWEEPFGRIAWEAGARAVPVLASDAGGLRECVPSAQLVAPRDEPSAWAAAIERVLGDHGAWTAASVAGRRHAATLLAAAPLRRLETMLEMLSTNQRRG
jgi:glycosyltransferase involved in cell wall biosynthesis